MGDAGRDFAQVRQGLHFADAGFQRANRCEVREKSEGAEERVLASEQWNGRESDAVPAALVAPLDDFT